MRWFFALSASTTSFDSYARMVQVAVASALTHTQLVPHFLFDGAPCALTDWLEKRGARVIYCRTRFYPALEALARKLGRPEHLTIGSGAFLRLEIPTIMRLFGWADEFVAYTDCDILFAGDPVPALLAARPDVFAVSVESDQTAWTHYSTGVMTINTRGLGAALPAIEESAAAHLEAAVQGGYDQQLLYHVFPVAPTRLPRELNWKSYWGHPPADASIIHFHGPKPLHRIFLSDPNFPALLRPLANESYLACCRQWDAVAATV